MHGSEPGDVYLDRDGKIWEVQSYCAEPTVRVVLLGDDVDPQAMAGGVSGLMWQGFRKIASRADRYPNESKG